MFELKLLYSKKPYKFKSVNGNHYIYEYYISVHYMVERKNYAQYLLFEINYKDDNGLKCVDEDKLKDYFFKKYNVTINITLKGFKRDGYLFEFVQNIYVYNGDHYHNMLFLEKRNKKINRLKGLISENKD
jgi:hypothetical protein